MNLASCPTEWVILRVDQFPGARASSAGPIRSAAPAESSPSHPRRPRGRRFYNFMNAF
jgi:hypothetical protein